MTCAIAAPVVSITAPVANGKYASPSSIRITASASNVAGATISKVQYYQGTTLVATAAVNTAPYSATWSNVTAGIYSLTAKVTDAQGNVTTSSPVSLSVINNSAPSISLTANPANAAAPATILLAATASDSDGSIAKVDFYSKDNSSGTTLPIATLTQAPYNTSWSNVAAGSYSLTAKATDNLGASTTSTSVPVTVTAHVPKVYDIQSDHLNTPRVITDSTGAEVWRWDSAPFGETVANENPQNTGVANNFSFNLRFPGQYFDKETGLHYNYFRDYDPSTGRYVQSDPIGLGGGINTYGYVGGNPVNSIDPDGLQIFVVPGPRPAPPSVLPGDIPIPDYKSNNGDDCKCKAYTDVYDSGRGNEPKHGREQRGDSSAEPANPVLALQNSVGAGRWRLGYDGFGGELVEFRLTRTDEDKCIRYWHGYVVYQRDLTPEEWKAGRGGGFPNWPKKPK
ncbi:RHS repeat-associated core domain-containing protein [Undibacterium sp. RuTC16W]|uniref:RHS repeat-associated core domain-containing protein n=1 Tax=Undibacterium sp. RuTC16W TaxID=3413048 RepID=UPI003BF0EE44